VNDEAEVIRRVVGGETEAFCLLVDRYQRPVLALAGGLLGNAEAAADVGQDVFLAAYERLGSFDATRSSFITWLLTIARNKCLNALKKKVPACPGTLLERPLVRTPEDELFEKEAFARLDLALALLPVEQRTAFVLAEFEGLSHEEISQIEGVAAGTIRSRLSRAKAELRVQLDELKDSVS
jgi:RNA polymerase sigma-70 factor, ECF subfamily